MIRRIHAPRLTSLLLAAALALLLAACQQSHATVAGGGIGGTGKGTITAISVPSTAAATTASPLTTGSGTVTFNGSRQFTLTAATGYLLDGVSVSPTELSAVAPGLVARVDVGEDVSPDFSSGTAVNVDGEHVVIGPVTSTQTSTSALAVLGQTVLTTATTQGSVAAASLALDQVVAVSGNTAASGVIQATRLDLAAAGTRWRLTGTVTGLVAGGFTIGPLTVLYNGHLPSGCGSGLANGDAVKVTAAPDAGYSPGAPLSTTTSVVCVNPGLELPPGLASGTIPVELEGFVSSVNGSDFVLSGQTVHTTAQTLFSDGQLADLQVGTRAEVTGSYDVASGVLTASQVEFSEQRVHMVAPLSAGISSGSVTLLGLPVQVTPLTDVDNAIASGSGLPAQVELNGFWDGTHIFATELTIAASTPNSNDVEVQGPVTATTASTLTLMNGLDVDLTNMCLGGESESGGCLSASQFLGQLQPNQLVDVQHAAYNGTRLGDNGTGNTQVNTED